MHLQKQTNHWTMKYFVALAFLPFFTSQNSVLKSVGPPVFFLQDLTDGKCLAGGTFKRCAVDTLWFVGGKPGSYQIFHRPEEGEVAEQCLDKEFCHLEESPLQQGNCAHCGANRWNILGDADTGHCICLLCECGSDSFRCRLRVDRRF